MAADEDGAPAVTSARDHPRSSRGGPGRPFPSGRSGNPAGRPPGSRSAGLRLLDQLGDEAAHEILQSLIKKAKQGDAEAAKLVLGRVWPPRKGRPTDFRLPELRTAQDAILVIGKVTQGVSQGQLTADEADGFLKLVQAFIQTVEAVDVVTRITALEQKVP